MRVTEQVTPDPHGIRQRARERLAAQDRRRRISTQLEQLAPLTRYYGPRPLRAVPLSQFLVEGWWAA